MPARVRALIAALIVAVVAFGAALFIGYRSGLVAAENRFQMGGGTLASLDLHFLGSQVVDQHLIDLAFQQVERHYYKPVESQLLINGERSGLLGYLRSRHIAARLPAATAAGDPLEISRTLDQQLSYAQAQYGTRLGKAAGPDLAEAAVDGMLRSLGDPYTVYLSPLQIQALNEALSGGNFGGIGVFIYQLRTHEIVLEPIEDLPAARAGMHGNEVVETIDGAPIRGLTLDRVERLIRGPEGTSVRIATHLYGGKARRHYIITREIIHVPTVHAKMENGYDYLRLTDFGESSAQEVHKALLAGKAQGAKGYIIDLRDNGGGLLDAAVAISSFFIPNGPIVTEIDRAGDKQTASANGAVVQGIAPLVVLVNGYTASASEITAGALQDYKAATLIGTKTFGKGVVQGIFTMPNGGALKITTQRYLTPAGRDIQHKGIQPDIVVTQSPDMVIMDTPRDKQLKAAKAYLAHSARY